MDELDFRCGICSGFEKTSCESSGLWLLCLPVWLFDRTGSVFSNSGAGMLPSPALGGVTDSSPCFRFPTRLTPATVLRLFTLPVESVLYVLAEHDRLFLNENCLCRMYDWYVWCVMLCGELPMLPFRLMLAYSLPNPLLSRLRSLVTLLIGLSMCGGGELTDCGEQARLVAAAVERLGTLSDMAAWLARTVSDAWKGSGFQSELWYLSVSNTRSAVSWSCLRGVVLK